MITAEATKNGFSELTPSVYQRTIQKRQDPVPGLVTVSDKPQYAFRFIRVPTHLPENDSLKMS